MTTFGEAFAAAEAAVDWPEIWTPTQPGDTLAGTLVGFSTTPKGHRLAVISREEDDVEVATYLSNVALVSGFERLDPQPGERIGIKFTGMKTSKSGREYKSFVVVMPDRETGEEGGPDALPTR